MIGSKKVVVVLPAYNAEKTLKKTYSKIPRDVADEILLVDDGSHDQTVAVAQKLSIPVYQHTSNKGYGGNQKTCYQAALDHGADIVVMLHPDYQYPPELIPALAGMVASGMFPVVLGSRLMTPGVLARGMPFYKYLFNKTWTLLQNILLGQTLSEYHTGFRAFSRDFLLAVPLLENSDDFLFDNQLLVQAVYFKFAIGEVSTPAWFPPEASSINPWRGTWYGIGVLGATFQYLLQKIHLAHFLIFDPKAKKLSGVARARK